MNKITFTEVLANEELRVYVERGDALLGTLGYTDHSAAHTVKVGQTAAHLLTTLGYSEEEAELARIAGYIHDVGNMINRVDHAQTGALLAFDILTRMGMPPADIADVVSAIGNHDEGTGSAVSPMSAAIIISDKTDVRRSRVRNTDFATFDIHDRVNHAVVDNALTVNAENREILLTLTIDTSICSVIDYFEIFLARMLMCRRAADTLASVFGLVVNGTRIM